MSVPLSHARAQQSFAVFLEILLDQEQRHHPAEQHNSAVEPCSLSNGKAVCVSANCKRRPCRVRTLRVSIALAEIRAAGSSKQSESDDGSCQHKRAREVGLMDDKPSRKHKHTRQSQTGQRRRRKKDAKASARVREIRLVRCSNPAETGGHRILKFDAHPGAAPVQSSSQISDLCQQHANPDVLMPVKTSGSYCCGTYRVTGVFEENKGPNGNRDMRINTALMTLRHP